MHNEENSQKMKQKKNPCYNKQGIGIGRTCGEELRFKIQYSCKEHLEQIAARNLFVAENVNGEKKSFHPPSLASSQCAAGNADNANGAKGAEHKAKISELFRMYGKTYFSCLSFIAFSNICVDSIFINFCSWHERRRENPINR